MRIKHYSVDMCDGPIFKNIIVYTVPVILTGVLQLLFNSADLIVIGQYCGDLPFAAVGSTGSLINLIVNLFMGLSVGVGVVVAQGLGAKDRDTVSKAVHTAIPAAIAGGIALTVIGISFAGIFLRWMDTPSEVLPLATLYMRIYFAGIIPILIFNFGAAILRAAGDTKSPLIYLTAAGLLNVLLNVVFVLCFDMDVDGVALATTITQTLAAVLVVRALIRRNDACKLSLKLLKFHKDQLLRITRIGLPAGIQGTIFAISNVIVQSSINAFGTVVLAGNTAAANIEGFVYVSMNAFHQTAMNFIGQNVGAKKTERINPILRNCLTLVAVTGLVLGLSAFILARPLLSIYTDSADSINYGVTRMSFISALYFCCGMMDVMTGAIRGMGSSIVPMIVTIIGVCGVRITWIYTVFQSPQFHTLETLYLSYPVSWIATFLVQIIFFIAVKRRLEKRQKEKSGLVYA